MKLGNIIIWLPEQSRMVTGTPDDMEMRFENKVSVIYR
jgi:hypothetical protein